MYACVYMHECACILNKGVVVLRKEIVKQIACVQIRVTIEANNLLALVNVFDKGSENEFLVGNYISFGRYVNIFIACII